MIPVECIARGYLAGLGLDSYRTDGTVSGIPLPPGLSEGSQLPEPIFTPTTKATAGHDEFLTFDDVVAQVGAGTAAELRRITLEVYRRGAELAASRGVIIADTKLEFGRAPDGSLVLADEVLTSDSSRFWAAEEWQPGGPQRYLDKQFVRDWSTTITSWDRTPPGPPIPQEMVNATRRRYVELYERITQNALAGGLTRAVLRPEQAASAEVQELLASRGLTAEITDSISRAESALARCCGRWASHRQSTPWTHTSRSSVPGPGRTLTTGAPNARADRRS